MDRWMEGRDRRKWGRRKKGTRERGSRPSSFAVLAYDAPPAGGEGGEHCSSRHNGGTKPQPEDRTLLQTPAPSPSLFSLRESTPLLLAPRNSQPTYPPRRGRAASPRFPIHARHASYRRFSNDENGEWRKDGRKPSTKKSPFRGKTKTRISRRGNTNRLTFEFEVRSE